MHLPDRPQQFRPLLRNQLPPQSMDKIDAEKIILPHTEKSNNLLPEAQKQLPLQRLTSRSPGGTRQGQTGGDPRARRDNGRNTAYELLQSAITMGDPVQHRECA
jgi:hypothetical protein